MFIEANDLSCYQNNPIWKFRMLQLLTNLEFLCESKADIFSCVPNRRIRENDLNDEYTLKWRRFVDCLQRMVDLC